MNIGIIGAGNVGGALAKGSVRAGHRVAISAKDPSHAKAKADAAGARAATSNRDAVKDAEVVILALPYTATLAVVDELGAALAGKVLVDVTNRTSPTPGSTIDGTSASEQIQSRTKAKVVKAFNTVFASRMADASVDGHQLDGYLAGDDATAKAKVTELLRSIGYRPIDAGPIAMARALEAMGVLNITLQIRNGWPWQSGFKLVGPTAEKRS